MAGNDSNPADEVDFSTYGQALPWFQNQSREARIALTVRSAFRVLPSVETDQVTADLMPHVTLSAFRACFVACTIAEYPLQRDRLRSNAAQATRAVSDFARGVTAAYVASLAGYLAENADNTAIAAATTAAASADAAAVSAAAADTAAVRADAVAIEQGRSAAEIIAAPLWPGEIPEQIVNAWDRLRTWMLEDKANNWDPWVQWYERVRDGRPSFGEAFDLAVASLTDEEWNEEPVPAAVNRRIAALLAEHTRPEPIPPQGPGPHFTLGPNLRIALAPPAEIDADGNNLARIHNLLPVVRQAAADLAGHLNPNTQPEISRTLGAYRAAIAGEPETIAWGIVFGLGIRLDNAAAAARREIEDRLQPPLEDAAQEALDTVLTLHGPLILATKEGSELSNLADEYRLTPEQRAALRADAQLILRSLNAAPDAIDAAAANAVEAAAEVVGEGPHPERGVAYWFGTVRNIAVILVPAAVLATAGAVAGASFGAVVGGISGAAVGAVGTAALRESDRVKLAAQALGAGYDRLLERGGQAMVEGLRRLTPFRRLILALEAPLRRYADTAQLRWMVRYIDFVVRTDGQQ